MPLQAIALAALDQLPSRVCELLFPAPHRGYLDLHNFRNGDWKPAKCAARIEPFRRIYDLRHTFATFALPVAVPLVRCRLPAAYQLVAPRGCETQK